MHDRGLIHCDIKPANIPMRGSPQTRGCSEKQALVSRELGEWDPVVPCPKSKLQFDWQIPSSFEALVVVAVVVVVLLLLLVLVVLAVLVVLVVLVVVLL
eukprot:1696986-Pyramimonas_sp.AAC.1